MRKMTLLAAATLVAFATTAFAGDIPQECAAPTPAQAQNIKLQHNCRLMEKAIAAEEAMIAARNKAQQAFDWGVAGTMNAGVLLKEKYDEYKKRQ